MQISPYDTLACRSYQLDEIIKKIRLAQVEDEILQGFYPKTGENLKNIFFISPANEDIPAFSQPLLLQNELGDKEFFIDVRSYAKKSRDGSLSLVNTSGVTFEVVRSVFNQYWLEEPKDLMSLGDLVPKVFMNWISNALSRKVGLTPEEQVRVKVVTVFYWFSLFRNEFFDEREKMRILGKLNQISSIPTTLSSSLVDEIAYMGGVEDFLDVVRHVVGNPRLDNISAPFLFTALGGTFFGVNPRETIGVAVEHPPTFMAMLVMIVAERGSRRSSLGELVHNHDRAGLSDTLTKNAARLIDSQKLEK